MTILALVLTVIVILFALIIVVNRIDMKKIRNENADLRNKNIEIKEEVKYYEKERTKIDDLEKKLDLKEQRLDIKEENLNRKNDEIIKELGEKHLLLDREISSFRVKNEEFKYKTIKRMEELGGFSKDELEVEIREEIRNNLVAYERKQLNAYKNRLELEKRNLSKKILLESIENISAEITSDYLSVNIELPNDEFKGKLIGKDGRNIRAIENQFAINLIIDDRPGVISVSTFDCVRRAIAVDGLKEIINRGSVSICEIESQYEKSKNNIDEFIIVKGTEAINKFGIDDLSPEIVKIIGSLYFRNSYNQNVYDHSIQVAEICRNIAVELGLDAQLAARCGLLHDIGKLNSEHSDKTHVEIGKKLAKMYGESELVINAIASHHNDCKSESYYAELVKIADTVSASRPGARNYSIGDYIKRIKSIEEIANEYECVETAFALQGGREVRVIVNSKQVNDSDLEVLANKIRNKIEKEITFPGTINVIVLRETKYNIYATKQNQLRS